MRKATAIGALVLALAGCGSQTNVVIPSADRLDWTSQLGKFSVATDPALVARVRNAARDSGAKALEVDVVTVHGAGNAPVVTLQSSDPVSYLKREMRRFLGRIGVWAVERPYFVELVDGRGQFAWSAGRFPRGGMVPPRPDLDACSPIQHGGIADTQPPPCPAK